METRNHKKPNEKSNKRKSTQNYALTDKYEESSLKSKKI